MIEMNRQGRGRRRDSTPTTDWQDGEWFAPKTFGYGATPATWQGWALLFGYVALVALDGFVLLPRHWTLWAALLAIVTLAFTVIVAQHPHGGLRWRWGSRK
jgi:hypothetical protein